MNYRNIKRFYASLLAMVLLVLPIGRVATQPTFAQSRVLPQLTAGTLNIHWNSATGNVEFLSGRSAAARLAYAPTSAEDGDPAAIAFGYLQENRALFGIRDARAELRLLRIEPDLQLNYSHVRLDQVYQGLPVFGKQLVVHLDAQNQIVAVNGQFQPNIDLDTRASISAEQAEGAALHDLLDNQLEPEERARVTTNVLRDKTQLLVYVDSNGQARLAWYITVMTTSPLGQWRSFVNAHRPTVIHAFNGIADAKRRITYTARNTTALPGQRLIDEGERSRDAVAQAAHDSAGVVYDYYMNNFKRDSIDGHGMAIVSTVHFGSDEEDAENAAWIGEENQMVYGDGGQIFKPLAYGLDVVGHELTHGVTDNTSQLIYEGQSGALNESYSDVFGALIEGKNWTMGEEVIKSPPYPAPYLRSLEDPNMNGLYDPRNPLNGVGQPATVAQYARLPLSRRSDNGGVHINSGIPNYAAYLIAQAIGNDKTGQVYYRTLTQYLTPDSDFFAAAQATVRAAQDLYSNTEVSAITQAFRQIGLDVGGSDTVPQSSDGNTTPAQPTTPVPAPTTQPAGCTDVINNGSFESDASWQQVSQANAALIDTELPHTGKRSAWLGGTDQESLQYIYQTVRLPANASSINVSYYRLVHEEISGVLGVFSRDATFSIVLANEKGDIVQTIEELASINGDDTWHSAQFDLSQYAGKTLQLTFAAENPRGNISSLFVDDVSLVACTNSSGNSPSVPQPTTQNAVYIAGTISNSDTGRGVAGAEMYVMRPGLSADDAAADDTITSDEVIATGTTDNKGYYQSSDAIPSGQTYSVIVIADGYRPIIANDGMEIPSNAKNPFQVDAQLRRSR